MVLPDSQVPTRAIAYALLSQTIWLPLLAIDVHDRWQAQRGRALERQAEIALSRSASGNAAGGVASAAAISPAAGPAAAAGAAGTPTSGLLLGASSAGVGLGTRSGPGAEDPIERSLDVPGGGALGSPVSRATAGPARGAGSPPPPFQLRPSSDLDLLRGGFRPSELLGGPLGLADLQAASMPGLAQAERARWAASGDPMAPLPGPWREAMRQAIRQLPSTPNAPAQVTMARVVHVPSSRVRTAAEVPVALQADGSVDILSQPGEAGVVEEIRSWSSQQQAPPKGQVAPAVVHLHPMPEGAPLSPETAAAAPEQAPPAAAPPAAAAPAPEPVAAEPLAPAAAAGATAATAP